MHSHFSCEARLARQCLSQFWLSAPVDQLELLYRSPIGDCYRLLLSCGLTREGLLPQEQGWKDALAHRLATAFERPETTNVLLAAKEDRLEVTATDLEVELVAFRHALDESEDDCGDVDLALSRPDGAEQLLLPNLLAAIGFCASTSEARRLIQGGGVKVDGEVAADPKSGVGAGTYHVQAGKRKHARVTVL